MKDISVSNYIICHLSYLIIISWSFKFFSFHLRLKLFDCNKLVI